jgi:hypothetical protein
MNDVKNKKNLKNIYDLSSKLDSSIGKIYSFNDLVELDKDAALQFKNANNYSFICRVIIKSLIKFNIDKSISDGSRDKVGLYLSSYRNYFDVEFPVITELDGSYGLLRNKLPPTHIIKNETGLILGYLAIFFNILGPTCTFLDGEINHAIMKADFDLQMGIVDKAIVINVELLADNFLKLILERDCVQIDNHLMFLFLDRMNVIDFY